MGRKARILIVDDDELLLNSLERWLSRKENDYTVFTALTPESALAIAEREWLHLALIDIRLTKSAQDRSGFDLARKIWSHLPKIFLTGLTDGETILEGFSKEMKEKWNVVDYVPKRAGEQKLLEAISNSLGTLNLGLHINWGEYSARMLVEKLKGYRHRSEEEKRALTDELEGLFCVLFNSARSIELIELKKGKGGCAVVRLRPTLKGGCGADVMVKFGPRETIMEEWANYKNSVEGYVPHGSTVVSDAPAQTFHLAAIKYSFIGGAGIDGPFREYFRRAAPEQVDDVLTSLFRDTCGQWYANRYVPGPEQCQPLDVMYRSRKSLNLADDRHVGEVEDLVEQLLRPGSSPCASAFQKMGDAHLRVNVGGGAQLLPNPLHFALRERAGERAAAKLFPEPSLMAITHGDLNGDNILVSINNKPFLIDFFKTGDGPVFRDFVVLESIIKFELLEVSTLLPRFHLETALLEPLSFTESISAKGVEQDPELRRILRAVQRLRQLAFTLTGLDDMYEYYVGLLFYALKEIVGFSSSHDQPVGGSVTQYHALFSAAKIAEKLSAFHQKPGGSADGAPLIFISYAVEDAEAAREVYARLSAEGYAPWMAAYDIMPGEDWDYRIRRAVRDADFFLPIVTRNSADKRGYLRKELKWALEIWLEKKRLDIYIIPAHLDESPVPEEIERFQRVDLFRPNGWENLLRSLREGVNRRNK